MDSDATRGGTEVVAYAIPKRAPVPPWMEWLTAEGGTIDICAQTHAHTYAPTEPPFGPSSKARPNTSRRYDGRAGAAAVHTTRALGWALIPAHCLAPHAQIALIIKEGEDAINAFGDHSNRLAQVMAKEFPAVTLEAVGKEFKGVAADGKTLNDKVTKLSTLLREEAAVAVHSFRQAEMWLRMKSPVISDGNKCAPPATAATRTGVIRASGSLHDRSRSARFARGRQSAQSPSL